MHLQLFPIVDLFDIVNLRLFVSSIVAMIRGALVLL